MKTVKRIFTFLLIFCLPIFITAQPVCFNLSDVINDCSDYTSGSLGASTDADGDGNFENTEYVSMTGALLSEYNTLFGSPFCLDTTSNTIFVEEQYQLIETSCGVEIRRRFRASNENGDVSAWSTQNIEYISSIVISDVSPCITGVDFDAAPIGEEDVTPGIAPYECDELKTFSATTTADCANATQYTWEFYLGETLIDQGSGNSFSIVVEPSTTYSVQFSAMDGCNQPISNTKNFFFFDCISPVLELTDEKVFDLNSNNMVTILATQYDEGSFDNCTDQSNLEFKVWHSSLGPEPQTFEEYQNLPTQIDFSCDQIGDQNLKIFVLDETGNLMGEDVIAKIQKGSANCSNCGQLFTDSGGANGAYGPNENTTTTFCPDDPQNQTLEIVFQSFEVEGSFQNCTDYLQIFWGNNSDTLGPYCEDALAGQVIAIDPFLNPTGCLSFKFVSNGSVQNSGWTAMVNCLDKPCTKDTLILNENSISSNTYQARKSILSSGKISPFQFVNFKAGETITLQAGFHAQASSDFLAKIEDCESEALTEDLPIGERSLQREEVLDPSLKVYPNPFTHQTTLEYTLEKAAPVSIQLYDFLGNQLSTFSNGEILATGTHQTTINGDNLVAGTYFINCRIGDRLVTKKIILVK